MTREAVVKRMAFHTQIPLLVIPELGMNMPAKSSMNRKNAVMD